MKVIEYIKQNGLQALNSKLGITVKEYPEGLIVLNYDQIESPKSDPVVVECRGLILDLDYNVVSRSFDRFFNLGEQPQTQEHLDWNKAECFEKVDGSLIKIYCWKGKWYVSTRGTAFAESGVNGFNITFKELVLRALDCNEEQFQARCDMFLEPTVTYICELTAMENRVVTRYQGTTLWFLAARSNVTGRFVEKGLVNGVGIKDIKSFRFGTVEQCVETAKNLKDLNEGYVVYQDDVPVCKVKSPAYVAVHHIRGNGTLNPNRIMQLVLMGEQDEYLKYFPEDTSYFTPYMEALDVVLELIQSSWEQCKDVEDQKEFALLVKDMSYSSVMFQAKKNKTCPVHTFHQQRETLKMKILEGYLQ